MDTHNTMSNKPESTVQTIGLENLLVAILKATVDCYPSLTNRSQDELLRYIFCGLDKTAKVVQGIIPLYSMLPINPDLEMPIGILSRSLLMDAILHMEAKSIASKADDSNFETVKSELKKFCYKLLNEPTDRFVNAIYDMTHLSEQQKSDMASRFVAPFSLAFEISNGRPKLLKDYKLESLSKIAKKYRSGGTDIPDAIFNLYDLYSKYDHLSHFTGLANLISHKHRENKVRLSILLIGMYVRDLIVLGIIFDPSLESLLPALKELDHSILAIPPEEFGEIVSENQTQETN